MLRTLKAEERKNSEVNDLLAPERLSRFLTFLLRHQPKDYPLAIDREGFAPWQEVVDMVQERFYDVTEEQIRSLIAGAEKKRFEMRGDKVRATYGHSFPVDLSGVAAEPPAELYFGAAHDLAQSMLHSGLTPRDRQYVHLSVTAEEAESVAKRYDPAPAIIVVDAQAAHAEGIHFYESGPLFLVENVPAKFLSLR
jgi:putative RNA 2'-phosphotransferase